MDKYVKVKPLGKGSFGAALLIKRKSDDQLLVVKEVNMAKMNTKEREEARNECRILQQLNHPNIVRYYEHMEKNGVLYIIMEYADGGDLHSKMKRHPGGLAEDVAMHYFAQICLAMDYLHSRHILHRDIKTMNVFLTSNGAVKLGDFGIATVLRNTMGLANTVCGTPYYFSPELCKNKPYNNRSDVWAMGVVLYELATGKHAFDGNSMQQLMQRILKTNAAPLSTTFSRDFRAMVDSCLQKDPLRRPNIKQLLVMEPVRGALVKLEQALLLATQCKVRLKDIVGSGSGSGSDMRSLGSPQSLPSPPSAQAVTAAARNNNAVANVPRKTPQQLLAEALAAPSPQMKPVIVLHQNNPNPSNPRKPSISPSRSDQQPYPAAPTKPSPPLAPKPSPAPTVSPPLSPKLGQVNAFIHELEKPLEEHAREAIRAFMKRKEEEAAEARRREAQALKELEEKKQEMLRVMAEHQQKMRDAAKLRQQKLLEQQQLDQQQQQQHQQQLRLRDQGVHRAAALQQQQVAAQQAAELRPVRRPPQAPSELMQILDHGHMGYRPSDITPQRNSKQQAKRAIAANSPRHPHSRAEHRGTPFGRASPQQFMDDPSRGSAARHRSESPHPTPPAVDVARASNWIEKQAQDRRNQKKAEALEAERRAVRLLGDDESKPPLVYQDDHSRVLPTRVIDPELDAWVRRQQNLRRQSGAASAESAAVALPGLQPSHGNQMLRALSDELPASAEARRLLRAQSESVAHATGPLTPPAMPLPAFDVNPPRARREQQQQQPHTARSREAHQQHGSSSVPDAALRSLTPPPLPAAVFSDMDHRLPKMDSLTGRGRIILELDQSPPPNGLVTQHFRSHLPSLPGAQRLASGSGDVPVQPTGPILAVEALDMDSAAGEIPEETPAPAEEVEATYENMLAHLKHVLEAQNRKANGPSSRHLAAISDVQTPEVSRSPQEQGNVETPQGLQTPQCRTSSSVLNEAAKATAAVTPAGAPNAPETVLRSRRMLAHGITQLREDIVCTEETMQPDDGEESEEHSEDDFADEVPITPFRNKKKKSNLGAAMPGPSTEEEEEEEEEGSSGYFEDEEDGGGNGEDSDSGEGGGGAVSQQQPLDEETQFAHYLAQFCGDHFAGSVPVHLDGTPVFSGSGPVTAATAAAARVVGPSAAPSAPRQKPLTSRLREYIVGRIGRTATDRSVLSLLALKTAGDPSSALDGESSPVQHIKNLIVTALNHRSGQGRSTTADALTKMRHEGDEVFCLCAQLLFLEEEGV